MDTKSQTVLMTGAAGGSGYELAKLFARYRCNLVLVARSAEKLTQLATELQNQFGVTVKTIPLDLTAPPAPKFRFDQLQRETVPGDILLNNACFGAFGESAVIPAEAILAQLQLTVSHLPHTPPLSLPPTPQI